MQAPEPGWVIIAAALGGLLSGCDNAAVEQSLTHSPSFAEGVIDELWSIGGASDEGGIALTGALSAVLNDSGDVVILDEMDAAVHRVTRDGRALHKIDRRGQGPGEFLMPRGAGFGPEGSIWTWDFQLQRFNWYDVNGGSFATWGVPPSSIDERVGLAVPVGVLAGGRVLARTVPPPGMGSPIIPVVSGDSTGQWVVHVTLEGTRLPRARVVTEQGLPMEFRRPSRLEAEPIYTIRPDGEAFSILDRSPATQPGQTTFQIHRFRSDGEPLGVVAIPYEPSAVNDSVRVALREGIASYLEQRVQGNPNLAVPSVAEVEEALVIPRFFPPVLGAFEDQEGYWLVREAGPPRVLERYTLEGSPVGRIQLPQGSGVVVGALGNKIIISRNDDMRIPTVTMYSVTWSESKKDAER